MGGTSVTYNVFHAVHRGELNLGLALLYGFAPVVAAALLSHIVAEYEGGKFLQGVAFIVMLTAMGLSIGATASVVEPAAGPWMKWAFGAVLDAAALVALRVILDSRNRRAAAADEAEQLRQSAREAVQARSHLEAELAATKLELEAAREAALKVPAAKRRTKAPRRRTASPATSPPRIPAPISAPGDDPISAPEIEAEMAPEMRAEIRAEVPPSADPEMTPDTDPDTRTDLDTEAQAFNILRAEPGIAGSELGRRLGVDPAHGRHLRRKLMQSAPAGGDGHV